MAAAIDPRHARGANNAGASLAAAGVAVRRDPALRGRILAILAALVVLWPP